MYLSGMRLSIDIRTLQEHPFLSSYQYFELKVLVISNILIYNPKMFFLLQYFLSNHTFSVFKEMFL